jgi:hypothetical protein
MFRSAPLTLAYALPLHTIAQYPRQVRRFASWLEAEGVPDEVIGLEPDHVALLLPHSRYSIGSW